MTIVQRTTCLARRRHRLRVEGIIGWKPLLLMQRLPISRILTNGDCSRWWHKVHGLLGLKGFMFHQIETYKRQSKSEPYSILPYRYLIRWWLPIIRLYRLHVLIRGGRRWRIRGVRRRRVAVSTATLIVNVHPQEISGQFGHILIDYSKIEFFEKKFLTRNFSLQN